VASENERLSRRAFMGESLLASGAGAVAGLGLEGLAVHARAAEAPAHPAAHTPAKPLPTGTIGKLKISRLICGGNLFAGSAHSRNLIYVAALMQQYFTPERIMDTLELCEASGINAAVMRCDQHIIGVLNRYRKERGGKIQWIAQTYPTATDTTNVKLAIDNGAVAAFPQGGVGDQLVGAGRLDAMGKVLSFIRQNGLAAGVGSHSLDTPKAVEKHGLAPDFYFKTFNSVGYNSQQPQEIADFMKTVERPWIAFKVLGAGVVKPRDGFSLALSMGADFLTVGMFDFQVKEDVKIVTELLAGKLERQRPWRS
jgi:hypothetical protein